MNTKLYNFVKNNIGTKVDFDGKFGSTCVDLARQYFHDVWGIEEHTGGVIGAKDLWLNYNNLPLEQKYFIRTVTNFRIGDVLIFNGTEKNEYGHVAIMLEERENDFIVFEQDGYKQDGAKISICSKKNLLGALRRK